MSVKVQNCPARVRLLPIRVPESNEKVLERRQKSCQGSLTTHCVRGLSASAALRMEMPSGVRARMARSNASASQNALSVDALTNNVSHPLRGAVSCNLTSDFLRRYPLRSVEYNSTTAVEFALS